MHVDVPLRNMPPPGKYHPSKPVSSSPWSFLFPSDKSENQDEQWGGKLRLFQATLFPGQLSFRYPSEGLFAAMGPLPGKDLLPSRLLSDKNGEYVLLSVTYKGMHVDRKYYASHKVFLAAYNKLKNLK